jgi:YYY domain-containing protein
MIALIASAGYSVAATLGHAMARRISPLVPGAIAALLLVGAGNLAGFVHLVERFPSPPSPSFLGLTWAASRAITGAITEFPYFTGLYADLHAHVVALPITILVIALSYAAASQPRLMLIALSESPKRAQARTVIVVQLAMLALALGTLFPTNAWDVPVYAALATVATGMAFRKLPTWPLRLSFTATTVAILGILAYLLFLPFHQHFVTLFTAIGRTRAPTNFWQFANHLGGLLTILGFGLVVALLGRATFETTLLSYPPLPLTMIGGSLLVAGISAPRVTWVSHAAMSIGIVAITALVTAASWSNWTQRRRSDTLIAAVPAVAMIAAAAATLLGYDVLALMTAFLAGGAMLWLRGGSAAGRFVGVLVAAGASVVSGVELVYVVDDLSSNPTWYRMNTVFKFYNQVWVLFALAAAPLLAVLIARAQALPRGHLQSGTQPSDEPLERMTPTNPGSRKRSEGASTSWARIGVMVSAVSIAAALCYPVLATAPRLHLRFPGHPSPGTLNALDWMRYGTITSVEGEKISFAGDKAVIDWFNEHVRGTPVIAEASIGPYRGNGSRISIATGLPTILGWDRHEYQQRYPEGIFERVADVRTLYDSPDPETKLRIIWKYGVQYVIVGDVERKSVIDGERYASAAGLDAFNEMVGNGLEIAFQAGLTTVYKVVEPSPVASVAAIDAESRG